jgi:hypothetical protein
MPYQFDASTLGTPCSTIVGTSGNSTERLATVIASARRRPLCACGSNTGTSATIICVCPPSVLVVAGAAPPYGTCMICVPVSLLNSSSTRCGKPPLPVDAALICPGRDFASAISSLIFFTGNEG